MAEVLAEEAVTKTSKTYSSTHADLSFGHICVIVLNSMVSTREHQVAESYSGAHNIDFAPD